MKMVVKQHVALLFVTMQTHLGMNHCKITGSKMERENKNQQHFWNTCPWRRHGQSCIVQNRTDPKKRTSKIDWGFAFVVVKGVEGGGGHRDAGAALDDAQAEVDARLSREPMTQRHVQEAQDAERLAAVARLKEAADKVVADY